MTALLFGSDIQNKAGSFLVHAALKESARHRLGIMDSNPLGLDNATSFIDSTKFKFLKTGQRNTPGILWRAGGGQVGARWSSQRTPT